MNKLSLGLFSILILQAVVCSKNSAHAEAKQLPSLTALQASMSEHGKELAEHLEQYEKLSCLDSESKSYLHAFRNDLAKIRGWVDLNFAAYLLNLNAQMKGDGRGAEAFRDISSESGTKIAVTRAMQLRIHAAGQAFRQVAKARFEDPLILAVDDHRGCGKRALEEGRRVESEISAMEEVLGATDRKLGHDANLLAEYQKGLQKVAVRFDGATSFAAASSRGAGSASAALTPARFNAAQAGDSTITGSVHNRTE